MKKILFISGLILALFMGACQSDGGDMRIELESPKLKVTTFLASATITWDAIAKADGYAYALGGDLAFTPVEGGAASTSLTLNGLSAGAHSIRIIATGNLIHTTDSAVRSIDFTIDPTLPSPNVTFTNGDNPGEMIIEWEAVTGAVGYSYKFSDEPAWVNVGADVLSATKSGMDPDIEYTFSIISVGHLPDSKDSQQKVFPIIDTSQGLWIVKNNGDVIRLVKDELNPAIYSATIACAASDGFIILIDGPGYGFITRSGNGGVGQVNSANATAGSREYVRESIGQMSAESAATNRFWVNISAASTLFVRVDLSYADAIPRYYLKLAESDSSIILAQYFDLMTHGGDWGRGVNGYRIGSDNASAAFVDGTEPTNVSATPATLGVGIVSYAEARPAYIANRKLEGWGIAYCYEFLGCIRLSNSSSGSTQLFGVLTTPALSALTASSTVTLTFDAVQFGAATNNITVKVLNAGKITSANVRIKGGAQTSITPEDDTSILMTNVHCPNFGNNDDKQWSNFTLEIEGATADTQIRWDASSAQGGISTNGRMCIDNIVVKK